MVTREEWAECLTCREMFGRRRPTPRRCKHCDRSFCEGEHGAYRDGEGGTCVACAVTHSQDPANGDTAPSGPPAGDPPVATS